MDISIFQNLNRFDTEYSHADCLDAPMALGTRLSFIVSQPASQAQNRNAKWYGLTTGKPKKLAFPYLYAALTDVRLEDTNF